MINWKDLFKAQKALDDSIDIHKGMVHSLILDQRILALLTEIGELSNEWKGFKFWSVKNQPRTSLTVDGVTSNPLKEEYADGLHFILSIGNNSGFSINHDTLNPIKHTDITTQFNQVFTSVTSFLNNKSQFNYESIVNSYIGLGFMLDFTPKQIEDAYFDKNKINHLRQKNGY